MSETSEFDILGGLLPQLDAEGYEVYINPNKTLLPPFMQNYRPNAIAFRRDKNLAIEISRREPHRLERVKRAIELFKDQPNWSLRVVWVDPASSISPVPPQSNATLKIRLDELRSLTATGHTTPALLLGWATFEAVARVVVGEPFERPQTASRLIQLLTGDGYISQADAKWLNNLAVKRNKLAHGDFEVEVEASDLNDFAAKIEELLLLKNQTAEISMHPR
jgi:hypothetical protein